MQILIKYNIKSSLQKFQEWNENAADREIL